MKGKKRIKKTDPRPHPLGIEAAERENRFLTWYSLMGLEQLYALWSKRPWSSKAKKWDVLRAVIKQKEKERQIKRERERSIREERKRVINERRIEWVIEKE